MSEELNMRRGMLWCDLSKKPSDKCPSEVIESFSTDNCDVLICFKPSPQAIVGLSWCISCKMHVQTLMPKIRQS